MTLTEGRALRMKIELAAPLLRRIASAFWETGDPRDRYLRYAQTMHAVIRASVPLMELAARRCTELAPADPVAADLGGYLRGHIEEERHHDDWLAEDLAVLGLDPVTLLTRWPAGPVAALAGAQYYWIRHYHPACLLGYIGALESTAPPAGMASWLAGRTGFPAAAFRTLEHHAQADLEHAAALYDLIDRLKPDPSLAAAIGCSALHTVGALGDLFKSLADPAIHLEQSHVNV